MSSDKISIPKRGLLQFYILKLIHETPRYGYEILNKCQSRVIDYSEIKSGTIYTMLHRLEENGYVASSWETNADESNKPTRIYSITPVGTNALLQGLKILSQRKPIFDELIEFYEKQKSKK